MDGKIIQEMLTTQGTSQVQMCTTRKYYGVTSQAELYCPFIPRLIVFNMVYPSAQHLFIGANGQLIRVYNSVTIEYTYSNNTITCQGLRVSTSTEYTLTAFG